MEMMVNVHSELSCTLFHKLWGWHIRVVYCLITFDRLISFECIMDGQVVEVMLLLLTRKKIVQPSEYKCDQEMV